MHWEKKLGIVLTLLVVPACVFVMVYTGLRFNWMKREEEVIGLKYTAKEQFEWGGTYTLLAAEMLWHSEEIPPPPFGKMPAREYLKKVLPMAWETFKNAENNIDDASTCLSPQWAEEKGGIMSNYLWPFPPWIGIKGWSLEVEITETLQGLITCLEEWLETGCPPEDREAVTFFIKEAKRLLGILL